MTKGRIARRVDDLDEDTLQAIASRAVSTEHAALDEILNDFPQTSHPLT